MKTVCNEGPEKSCQGQMPPQLSNSILVPAMAIQPPRFPPYKLRINPYKWRALAHTSAKRKPITQRDDPYKSLQGTIPSPYKLQALPESFPW